MRYVEIGNKWVNKDSVQERVEATKSTRISTDFAALLLKDEEELKTPLVVVERGLKTFFDEVEKIFCR